MKAHLYLASLLAAAIGILALTAAEWLRQARPDDPKKASSLREKRGVRLLEDRCQKLLVMQLAVSNGTVGLHKVIEGSANKKPRPKDKQVALKLSKNEKAIIVEATKTLAMLKAEGFSVAFSEVFQELREDMERVHRRLKAGDVGMETQVLEKDIIDQLQEMIRALK